MPSLDALPAERRSVIELALGKGRSYNEIAIELDLAPSQVRAHAREALATLSPRTADRVDPSWRDQVADYLLGQQSGPEATATRAHLKTSEPARAWALSVLDSLEGMYANGREPAIPDAEPGRASPPRPRRDEASGTGEVDAAPTPAIGAEPVRSPARGTADRPRPPLAAPAREALSPAAQSVLLRRRIAMAVLGTAAVALIALAATSVFGDDEGPIGPGAASPAEVPVNPVGQLELEPIAGEKGRAIAVITEQGGQPGLFVQGTLEPTGKDEAYEVWLYSGQGDAQSLGAQLTDEQGNYLGATGPENPFPNNFADYKYIDVSRESIDEADAAHSGDSVLRGKLSEVQPVAPAAAGADPAPEAPAAPEPSG